MGDLNPGDRRGGQKGAGGAFRRGGSPPPPPPAPVARSTTGETTRLGREVARRVAVSRKRISFAGTKDKRAVTTQTFCFEVPEERVRSLRVADVEILDAYPTDKKLELGDLPGNRFRIVIRDLAVPPHAAEATLAAA